MSFTDEEIAYARSQPLARIATVSQSDQPDVTPVGFEFDGTYFLISGYKPTNTRRSRNVRAGRTKIALVIDDVASLAPWTPRFLRVYGTAELLLHGDDEILKVTPTTSWSSNLSGDWSPENGYRTEVRKTDHMTSGA